MSKQPNFPERIWSLTIGRNRQATAAEISALTEEIEYRLKEMLSARAPGDSVQESLLCAVTDARTISLFWAARLTEDQRVTILSDIADTAKGSESPSEFASRLNTDNVEQQKPTDDPKKKIRLGIADRIRRCSSN